MSDPEKLRLMLTPVQETVVLNLLERMADTPVRVRAVEEFEGQINAPVTLEVVGGTRFVVYADGRITEYPREDE